ncbi:MAG TPA: RNA methyltransferase [Solirubrobacterales bacterium]|jgi:TrmH family RNA methyltransferase|nr:RNA methyltransferase [Solirubrobacterales bacterium]
MTITSPQNEKLKLVRRLARRRRRDAEGLFVAEGEDLLDAARSAGAEPVELLSAAGDDLGGDEVEPALLDGVSALGSGARVIGVWRERWASAIDPPCLYLHGISDPGNVGTIIRTAAALVGGTVALGPGCADPYGPRAVRASMGAIFFQPVARAEPGETPGPRAALVAHGGMPLEALGSPATLCMGSERDGLPGSVLADCEQRVTIALRPGAESLNVAAAAAIAMQRISSPGSAKMAPLADESSAENDDG